MITNAPESNGDRQSLEILPEGFKQKVLVTVFSGAEYRYGAEILAEGKLTAPKKSVDFDYPDYLAAKNIYGQMFLPEVFVLRNGRGNKIVYYSLKLKAQLFNRILKLLPQPQAGLMIALLSGDRNFLPQPVAANFNNTGTAHVIAVSGYKLTLVFISLEWLAAYLSRKKILALSLFFAVFYTIVADFAPAVLRAVIMSALFLLARTTGRKYAALPALLFTAAILLTVNPLIIKNDVGFILSFLGIAGIIYFGPLVGQLLIRVPDKFGLKEVAISSISAQLATAPVIAHFFNQFTPLAPLTNILTVPLMPPMILLGYLCALPLFGRLAAFAARPGLDWMLFTVKSFAALRIASLPAGVSGRAMLLFYTVEIIAYFLFKKLLKNRGASDKLRK